ncbi:MAG: hypothetical protein ACJAU0_001294 [Flavobacteriales bacterium]|jgi:hypothetical protein
MITHILHERLTNNVDVAKKFKSDVILAKARCGVVTLKPTRQIE